MIKIIRSRFAGYIYPVYVGKHTLHDEHSLEEVYPHVPAIYTCFLGTSCMCRHLHVLPNKR